MTRSRRLPVMMRPKAPTAEGAARGRRRPGPLGEFLRRGCAFGDIATSTAPKVTKRARVASSRCPVVRLPTCRRRSQRGRVRPADHFGRSPTVHSRELDCIRPAVRSHSNIAADGESSSSRHFSFRNRYGACRELHGDCTVQLGVRRLRRPCALEPAHRAQARWVSWPTGLWSGPGSGEHRRLGTTNSVPGTS